MSRRASWLLLCAIFAATFFLLKPRPWIGAATPAEVGAAELAGDGLYLAVESRHPSLFVTVDAAAWEASSVDQRHERVEHLGRGLTHFSCVADRDDGAVGCKREVGEGTWISLSERLVRIDVQASRNRPLRVIVVCANIQHGDGLVRLKPVA